MDEILKLTTLSDNYSPAYEAYLDGLGNLEPATEGKLADGLHKIGQALKSGWKKYVESVDDATRAIDVQVKKGEVKMTEDEARALIKALDYWKTIERTVNHQAKIATRRGATKEDIDKMKENAETCKELSQKIKELQKQAKQSNDSKPASIDLLNRAIRELESVKKDSALENAFKEIINCRDVVTNNLNNSQMSMMAATNAAAMANQQAHQQAVQMHNDMVQQQQQQQFIQQQQQFMQQSMNFTMSCAGAFGPGGFVM